MNTDSETSRRIVDSALALAERQGWLRTGMGDIAAEAELSLADLYRHFRSKQAILAEFTARIDTEVLAGTDGDLADQPVRDRLFDLVMRRLDALAPHKEAVRVIVRDSGRDITALCAGTASLMRSMRWTLEAAQIRTDGLAGQLRVKGLAAVYLATLRAWFDDDSEDMSHTMAVLDRNLKRADRCARLCGGGRRRDRHRPAEEGGSPEAEPPMPPGPAPGPPGPAPETA